MKRIGFLFISICTLYSCEKYMETKYTVMLNNKSATRLYVAVGIPGEGTAGIYPDTSLPTNKPIFSTIAPNAAGYAIYSSDKIETLFEKSLPKDTLSVYLFNADEVDAMGWSAIQTQYKVLKRYDLSLEDLEAANFIVKYPG